MFIRSLLAKDPSRLSEDERRIVNRFRKRTTTSGSGGASPRSRKRQRSSGASAKGFGSRARGSTTAGARSPASPPTRSAPLPHEFGENSAVLLQAQRVIVNVHSSESLSVKVVDVLQNYELALRRNGGEC